MSTGTYVPVTCAGCKQPITDANMIWTGDGLYHVNCRPLGNVTFGSAVEPPLTADLLRLIVREEVGKLLAAHGVGGNDGR